MTNRKNRRIVEMVDSVEPSDEIKERMLANIKKKEEARAASPENAPKPEHAAPTEQKPIRAASGKKIWMRWTAVAACLALIVAAAAVPAFRAFHKNSGLPIGDPGAATSAIQKETDRLTDDPGLPSIPGAYNDGVIGARPAEEGGVRDFTGGYDAISSSLGGKSGSGAIAEAPMDPALIDRDGVIEGGGVYNGSIQAGMLTAGEWKDADAIAEWAASLTGNAEWASFVEGRGLNTADFVKVTVKDGEKACFNAAVELTDGDKTLFTARTDINGNAFLFYAVNGGTAEQIRVKVGNTVQNVSRGADITVEAKDAGIDVTALDLMLMVDTTGSMGDELEYLKAELSDMVQRIAKQDSALSIRVSVNFYRDEGDEYVVKYFDFRDNIEECLEQIKEQSADGGGDYPEAVHTALENAVSGHSWREEAVKLCFIVLDAPPHTEAEVQGVNESLRNTVLKAAEAGIRIIPVASSGVDSETEFLLRSYALITGGTYVFLTNDSGIGYGHKDPDISEPVTVEALNDCMVRIACEYCGLYSGEKVPYTPPQTPYHQ